MTKSKYLTIAARLYHRDYRFLIINEPDNYPVAQIAYSATGEDVFFHVVKYCANCFDCHIMDNQNNKTSLFSALDRLNNEDWNDGSHNGWTDFDLQYTPLKIAEPIKPVDNDISIQKRFNLSQAIEAQLIPGGTGVFDTQANNTISIVFHLNMLELLLAEFPQKSFGFEVGVFGLTPSDDEFMLVPIFSLELAALRNIKYCGIEVPEGHDIFNRAVKYFDFEV